MNGRREKARQGGWNGGFAPYGYTLENGVLKINETEAHAIRKIFDIYVNSDIGMNALAKQMNLLGETKFKRQNGTLDRWTATTVKRILDNPVYIGKMAYGRRGREKVKGTKNKFKSVYKDEYILVDSKHEPIIDIETWNKARAKRKETGVATTSCVGYNRTHLLTKMLRCPKCGGAMYAQKTSYVNLYGEYYEYFKYRCLNNHGVRGKNCDFKEGISKEDLEPLVIQVVKDIIADESFAKLLKDELNLKINTTSLEEDKMKYQAKLNQCNAAKEDLEQQIDTLPLDTPYRERMIKDLYKRLYSSYDIIVELEEKIADLELKISGASKQAESFDVILNLLKNFGDIFDQATDEEKKQLLLLLIKKIELYEDLSPEHSLKSIEFNFPINLNGEELSEISFDENEDGIPVTIDLSTGKGVEILKNAKEKVESDPKPKKVTYKMLQDYIMDKYGFKVHSTYIAEVKHNHGLRMYKAPNAKEVTRQPRKHPKPEKVAAIEDALKFYGII